jgi:hypothetical protein
MRVLTVAFAIAAGVIVLLGYFVQVEQLELLRLRLIDWAIIIAAMAVLVGIYNLAAVQLEKIRSRQKGSIYGVVMLLSLGITFGFGLLLGPNNPFVNLAVNAVIVPVEASLMAILAVTLIYASIRLFRRRVDVMTILFLLSAVLFLLAIMPTPFGALPGHWIITQFGGMLSRGGARGLLLGISLGTLLTGLRVLFGIDRPYGGN